MKRPISLASVLVLAVAAACSRGTSPLPETAATFTALRPAAASYKLLASLGHVPMGGTPLAGVAISGTTAYGTTTTGGAHGVGTIYKVGPARVQVDAYDLNLYPEGGKPFGRLVLVNGLLYGTTSVGGDLGGSFTGGTVFSFNPKTKVVHVLHNFGAKNDGNNPYGGLLYANGLFYGTTSKGGRYDGGTIYSVTPAGVERVLHHFGSGTDGKTPYGELVALGNLLYGTTAYGGNAGDNGTAYSFDPASRKVVVLHAFAGGNDDGANPLAALVAMGAVLYGTTAAGGPYQLSGVGGTAFSLTTSGTETVLHDFGDIFAVHQSLHDGATPEAALVARSGFLYGVTTEGGTNRNLDIYGDGTFFRLTSAGAIRILHNFGGTGDGGYPIGLTLSGSTVYGVTRGGGSYGFGSLYTLTP